MATKKSNEARVIAWTGTMKVEVNGTISGCAIELFSLITTPEARKKALAVITDAHEKRESEGR